MQTQLLSWILLTLAVATVASVVGGGVYSVFRAFEKWNCDLAATLNLATTVLLLILLGACAPSLFLYFFIPALVAALCGSGFHRKSGGASELTEQAFWFMMAATLTTLVFYLCALVGVLFWVGVPDLPIELNDVALHFYSFLLIVVVPLTPFLLWLYQTFRLRPGIDRHLDAGEANSHESAGKRD